jgi:hypothetical protein
MSAPNFVPPLYQIPQFLKDDLTKLGPLFDASFQVHDLGRQIVADHIHGIALSTDFRVVSYIIFTKGFKSIQSAMNLCRSGCGSNALSRRAVLNAAATVLKQNPEVCI